MQSAETSFVEPPEAPALADPCPYLAHYGLRDVPFRVTADPRHLWLGGTHRVALDRLTAAVRDGDGIVLLTGDIGTGKTSLANGLAERLRDAGLLVGQLLDARIEASEFLQAVANAFRMTGTFDVKDEFVTRLEESGVAGACLGVLLDRARSSGRKVVLIIDEAQSLSEDCLRETAELSGLASTSGSSLVILLVAQKELSALLSDPRQEALNRRITARFKLEALEPDEVGEYIRHCLAAAGAPFEIFSAEAMHEIATLSRGAPRAINMVCDHALLTGGQRKARTITRDIIVDSGRMAQLESRAEPATVRLISFPRRRGAVVIRARRLQGRLGVPIGRGLLDTLARLSLIHK
jgi:general secretion pathway protein A